MKENVIKLQLISGKNVYVKIVIRKNKSNHPAGWFFNLKTV